MPVTTLLQVKQQSKALSSVLGYKAAGTRSNSAVRHPSGWIAERHPRLPGMRGTIS